MSRIASNPIVLPEKVEVAVNASELVVKGPLGTLRLAIAAGVEVKRDGNKVVFAATNDSKEARRNQDDDRGP